MVQKAKKIPNTADRLKSLNNHKSTLYGLNRLNQSPVTSGSAFFANQGGSAGGSTSASGNFLRTEGDTMVGPIAYYPVTVGINASDELDISPSVTNPQSSSYVIVSLATPDTLQLIKGAQFAGQQLWLQVPAASTLTVEDYSSNATGNIVTSDQADLVITTTTDPVTFTLLFDITLGPNGNNGAWVVLNAKAVTGATGGGSFANKTLSNLVSPTALNQDLHLNSNNLDFSTGNTEYMVHGGSSDIDLFVASTLRATFDANGQLMASGYRLTMDDEIRFTGITKPASNIQSKIYAENLTNDELVLNAPTSGKVRFDIAGTTVLEHSASELTLTNTGGHVTTIFNDDVDTTDDSTIANIDFQAFDSSDSTADIYSRIDVSIADNTSGTEDGRIKIGVIDGGIINGTFMKLESFAGEGNLALQADEKDFVVEIIRDEATNDTGIVGSIEFITNDTLSNATQFGKIRVDADTTTNGAESATFTMQAYNAGSQDTFLEYTGGTGIVILDKTTDKLGFYGSAGNTRQTLSGARDNPEAALAGLITALANVGIIVDSTTAS